MSWAKFRTPSGTTYHPRLNSWSLEGKKGTGPNGVWSTTNSWCVSPSFFLDVFPWTLRGCGILWYWFSNWAVAKRSCLSGGAKGMLTRQLTLCLRTHGFSLRTGIAYAFLRWCLRRLAYNRILLTRGPYCRFLTKHIKMLGFGCGSTNL